MAETQLESSNRVWVPGMPGIKLVRPESGTHEILDIGMGRTPIPGVRKLNLRAETDISPTFGSVKEAVTRFGGSWGWPPLYKLGESGNVVDDFDIKKVEEQATELEKDLIVKELETLDVLEELGTTKRIVEELKRQLQQEVPKCFTITENQSCEKMSTPSIKEMNKENRSYFVDNHDLILMELKQVKVNLGKTITDLGAIQCSVESLKKKLKKEKVFLERTQNHDQVRRNPTNPNIIGTKSTCEVATDVGRHFNSSEQAMVEPTCEISNPMTPFHQKGINMNTFEMRWVAAKKMEAAAKATEYLALVEMKALTNAEKPSGFILPEPEVSFPFRLEANPGLIRPRLSVLRRMEEATEEILHCKKVLEEALNRVEIANRKQHSVEEAIRKWISEYAEEAQAHSGFRPAESCHNSPLPDIRKPNRIGNGRRLKPAVSMRDVLSRKQVLSEAYVARNEVEERGERQKVSLNQMLHALREDLTLSSEPQNDVNEQKPIVTPQRKKLGFIQISLPLIRPNKRRT